MPDTPSTDATATVTVDPAAQPVPAGWDNRVGAVPNDAQYGNPYDPNAPVYSVYRDPVSETQRQAEEEEQKRAAAAAKVKGSTYRFLGHPSPYEWTAKVRTSGGEAAVGETVKMTDEEAELLTTAGYELEKLSAAEARKAASDEGGDD